MTDWAATGRRDYYRATLVDPFTLEDVAPVDIVPEDTSVTLGYFTDNSYQASISVVGAWRDGLSKMVRLFQYTEVDGYRGEREIGTFFIDDAPSEAEHGCEEVDLSCYSTMLRFTGTEITSDVTTRRPLETLRSVFADYGGQEGQLLVGEDVVEPAAYKSTWLVAQVGDKASTALNTLASWLDAQIDVDPHGNMTLERYVSPYDREPVYTFDDVNSVYLPGVSVSNSNDDMCNYVSAFFTSNETTRKASARLDADNPFSFESIGRWVCKVVKVSNDMTQQKLQEYAERVLAENSGEILYYEIEAVNVPFVRTGDVVVYRNSRDFEEPVAFPAMVTEISFNLTPGAVTRYKLRRLF